jgi:hypothetical protein
MHKHPSKTDTLVPMKGGVKTPPTTPAREMAVDIPGPDQKPDRQVEQSTGKPSPKKAGSI